MARSNTTAGTSGGGASESSFLPEGWEDWPTLTQAAKLLTISRRRLAELIGEHSLKKVIGPRGSLGGFRLDPRDVDMLENLLESEDEADAAPATAAVTTAETVRASVEGLKQAQQHAERLITLFDGPYKFVLDTLRAENGALREELTKMRAERAQWQADREAARSQQTMEALALAEVKSEAHTKAEAVDLLKKLAVPMLSKHLGITDPRAQALQEALAAIPRESFEVLFKMGVLPPEAEAKLKVGLDWKDEPAPTNAEAAE